MTDPNNIKYWAGVATGAGIALADAVYAFTAVYGFSMVSGFTADFTVPLRLTGSLFLGFLGIRELLSLKAQRQTLPLSIGNSGIVFSFISAFLLTFANPATILTFMALAALLGTAAGGSHWLPSGILLGSSMWWVSFSAFFTWIGHKFTPSSIRICNLSSSVLLILFSLYGLGSVMLWDRR